MKVPILGCVGVRLFLFLRSASLIRVEAAVEGRGVARVLLGLVGAVEALLGGGGMGSSSVVSPSSALRN